MINLKNIIISLKNTFIKLKETINEDKSYGKLIDSNYFSDTLMISRGVLKQLADGKKKMWELQTGYTETDSRVLHEIPYSSYLKYIINDFILRGLIKESEGGYFELTSKGFEIFSNYTLDNLALTAYSNRLTRRLSIITLFTSIVAILVSLIAIFSS